MIKKVSIFIILAITLLAQPAQLQDRDISLPLLTVKEVMDVIITPMSAIIWGAYELETDGEWLEVSNAALAVIAAGDLLAKGGAGVGEIAAAVEPDWQRYNNQMINAARQVLEAVENKNEEALFSAGNDALYPPCESCHQQYQNQ